MSYGIKIVLVFILSLKFTYDCLKVIPERASITYINETYVANVSINVRRIKRRGDYVVNFEFTTKMGFGDNASLDLVFYEYLHNEFRRSFIEKRYKACDLVHKDAYFGLIIRNAGFTTCPFPPGKFSMKNVILNSYIPSVWPFEKGKGELTAIDDTNGVIISKGEIVLTFKQK